MGVEVKYSHPVTSMKALLDEGYDAVFIGSGAPKGKELDIPGRWDDPAHVHIGIDWLESIHFGHTTSVGENVLVIGVGNTAMDCCRSSKRLGGKDVKVMARRERPYFKASPWELEDAEEEQVEILVNHAPASFVIENGRVKGMMFDLLEWYEEGGKQKSKKLGEKFLPAQDVILAIGQETAFPWIERDIGIEFNQWDMPAAWGPENIIWAVRHAHEASISIHNHCQGIPLTERPPEGMNLVSAKLGMHAWSYHNDYNPSKRQKMVHVDLEERLKKMATEVELGFDPTQAAREVQRCLNCDIQTHFAAPLCIECDACIDVCPVTCLTITVGGEEEDLRTRLLAPADNLKQAIYQSEALPQTGRVMVKDEDLCVHCGLCAERCPTAAWDMMKFDLLIPYAGRPAPAGTLGGAYSKAAGVGA
jgi:formate dehydrogenase beta subunit